MLRWALPFTLLFVELLALSLAIDLPTAGPAMGLVTTVRLVIPVVVGAVVGAWLLHGPVREAAFTDGVTLPPWRPWPALALQPLVFTVAAASGWHLLREGAPPPTAGALAAWLGVLGLGGLLALWSAAPLGWSARVLVRRGSVPILAIALGLLAWRAAAAAEGLWGVLSDGTLHAVAAILRATAGEVNVDPAGQLIGLRGFNVTVAPVCSGVDGLGLVLVFQATWLSLTRTRLRFPHSLALLPLGAAAALLANVARISLLVLLGASGREELALGAFHSKLGMILFIAIALGSIALAERAPWLRRSGEGRSAERHGLPDEAAAYVAPFVAALVAAVLISAFREGALDVWYAARIGAALGALWLVRGALPAPTLAASWTPVVLGLAVGVLWLFPARSDSAPIQAAVSALTPAARTAWILIRAAGAVLVIPLVEELAFRGFLLPWLSSGSAERSRGAARSWTWPAVLISSIAFGAVHERWIVGSVAGLAFAAARLRRGRLGDAVVAHAVANAVLTAAVLGLGRWDLWS